MRASLPKFADGQRRPNPNKGERTWQTSTSINSAVFAIGTTASDTFNIFTNVSFCTVLGLDGDDTFNVPGSDHSLLDGGAGNDSFTFGDGIGNSVLGGEGNDTAFFAIGHQNNVYGGAGNDWIGIMGSNASYLNVFDGGDGDDFIGAQANSNWLVGGTGNDILYAEGESNALVGGDGNDKLEVVRAATIRSMAGSATTACTLRPENTTPWWAAPATTGSARTAP